jgi:hypothetical protein
LCKSSTCFLELRSMHSPLPVVYNVAIIRILEKEREDIARWDTS